MITWLKKNILLVCIVLLAIVLRFAGPHMTPPALNWDEISHGYNAYSILSSGKDEWGVAFPSIFRAYGDFKLPVYIYATVVSEALFGLTPFAVRLVSGLAGISLALAAYFLAKELFPRVKTAWFVSALLVAVAPWSLFLARAAFEANLAVSFIAAGVYLFLKGLKFPGKLVLAAVVFGLSVWTYNSARVFVPLFVLALALIYWRSLKSIFDARPRVIYVSLATVAVFFLPMFWQLAHPVGQARYAEVAILNQGAINQIIEKRQVSHLPELINRIVNNRPVYFATTVAKNYVTHFSPDFLFFDGGSQYQFSVQGRGLLYLVNLPFALVGMALLLLGKLENKHDRRRRWLLFAWLLLAPLASSVTRDQYWILVPMSGEKGIH